MKRLFVFILTIILTLGMITAAFAATPKITGIKESIDYNAPTQFIDDVRAQTVWEYPLTANMFEWSDGFKGAVNAPVTASQLNSAEIAIRVSGKDTSMIKDISIDTKAFPQSHMRRTAYVKVTFVDEYANLENKNFRITVFLTLKRARQSASEMVLEGTFGNPTVNANVYDDYVSIAGGKVLVPDAYISSIDVDLGNGVLIRSALYKGRKYYGTAKEEITYADNAVLSKYPSIETIFVLRTAGFDIAGKKVMFEFHKNYYVYSAEGKYLGRTNELVPYSNKYYMSNQKIDAITGISSGSSDSSSGSTTTDTVLTDTTISVTTATKQTETAIKAAGSAKTINMRFLDAQSISAEALQAVNNAAVKAGVSVNMLADTMNGKNVVGRLTIKSNLAAKLKSGVRLGVYVDESNTIVTQNKFEKWFPNNIAVVSLAQKNSYGMSVGIVAKVNLTGLDTKTLYFYRFDKSTNKYKWLPKSGYWIDTNGYLHFGATEGGEYIITDRPLNKR